MHEQGYLFSVTAVASWLLWSIHPKREEEREEERRRKEGEEAAERDENRWKKEKTKVLPCDFSTINPNPEALNPKP